ncbi:immunoglobulin-like domain-containing protein [Halalkalibaculum sp. DA3122]|uniref:immunoglobulin-like domain-containing protein n=1 Tax=unclassified Halalkalibaculum TaxID=2964617 RepID=UPI00375436DD
MILVFASIALIGCNVLGIGGSEFEGLSITTEKQQYSPNEPKVITFNNTSKQTVYLENCSWVLEKNSEGEWEVVNGVGCDPIAGSVDIPIKNNDTYRDTIRFSINSGSGEYRYRYSVLNSDKKKIPDKFATTNVFLVE